MGKQLNAGESVLALISDSWDSDPCCVFLLKIRFPSPIWSCSYCRSVYSPPSDTELSHVAYFVHGMWVPCRLLESLQVGPITPEGANPPP